MPCAAKCSSAPCGAKKETPCSAGWTAKIRAIPGPDASSQALFRLESIARIAPEAGDWDLAEFTARQMLEHNQAYVGSHYALTLVTVHEGDVMTTHEELTAAEKLWSKADPDLPELARLRQKLSAQR